MNVPRGYAKGCVDTSVKPIVSRDNAMKASQSCASMEWSLHKFSDVAQCMTNTAYSYIGASKSYNIQISKC